MQDQIVSIEIEDYLSGLMPPRPEVFAELEARARERGLPLMGPVQGSMLYLLALISGARRALEIGTATGYAAMWLLRGVAPHGGTLTVVERNPDRYNLARDYITRAGFGDQLDLMPGEWQEILPNLTPGFDLIFLDILRSLPDDTLALKALNLCVGLLAPGGLLIGDNVLVSGLVLEQEDASPTVRGIQRFNRAIMSHPDLESVIMPLRDGISLSRKRVQ